MIKLLKTKEGKIVKVDMEKDTCLYQAPVNPPHTGTAFTRGTNLYAHKTEKGGLYFYAYDWTMWDKESDSIYLVSEKEAREFLIEKAGIMSWGGLNPEEMDTAEEFFPGIFEETA